MNTEQLVKALDSGIESHKDTIGVGNALTRLRTSQDFKKVIGEGYFEKEAIRLVHLKADPGMQTPEKQDSIVKQMDAIGSLAEYLNLVMAKASWATKALESDEETRAELLALEE